MSKKLVEVDDRRPFDKDGNPTAVFTPDEPRGWDEIVAAARTYGPPYPILDKLLVLQSKRDTHYGGSSIIIPEVAQKDKNKGVVVAVSPILSAHGVPISGVWMPCNVKEGDVVTFTQFTDETFTIGEDVYALISIHDVKFVESVSYVTNPAAVANA